MTFKKKIRKTPQTEMPSRFQFKRSPIGVQETSKIMSTLKQHDFEDSKSSEPRISHCFWLFSKAPKYSGCKTFVTKICDQRFFSVHGPHFFRTRNVRDPERKQAGAELCQAQVKQEVKV